jgi:hypothetical protein
MAKYISEQTMRRIQIINADTPRLLARRRWIQLACDLAVAYYYYSAMRTAGENANEEMPELEEIEEILPLFNQCLGVDVTLSELYDTHLNGVDNSITYYKLYKDTLRILDGKMFKPALAEQLFKELYEEYTEIPFIGLIHQYYSEVARLILQYMCENIDYNTFMTTLLNTKTFEHQRPMDGQVLRTMIKTGVKWVNRYLQIAKAQL